MAGDKSGIILTKLTPVGILKEVGVAEGDVIKSINGLNLNTPHQVFNAYKTLKDQKELRVDIIRDNKPLVLTYIIKG